MNRDWQQDINRFANQYNEAASQLEKVCVLYEAEKERAEIAESRLEMLKEAYKMMYKYVPELARKEYGFEEFYNALYPKE